MTEQEFLNILESSLSGELPGNEIRSNVQYYRDYIKSQKSSKSEREIMEALGDPRLIARTIIDTYQLSHPSKHYGKNESDFNSRQYQDPEVHQADTSYEYQESKGMHVSERKLKAIGWAIGIGTVLILLLILGTIFWLGVVVLKIFVRFILPILLIAIGITWIKNQIRRR
ncbi:MAG: DUF1700 domain-containing protein [Clostridiales bacterium]|nr:DUF1700 domain-containing protein [Clostridiales bacterium]